MKFNKAFQTLQNLSNAPVRPVDIATALGVSRSTVNYKSKNNVDLTENELCKMEKFFKVSLLNVPKEYQDAFKILNESEKGMPEIIKIEYYPNVYLSAGYGVEVYDENCELVIIDERFLTSEKGMRINPKNCKMVKVSGNSMSPDYIHGDRVIIDESDHNLTDGQIYAFRYDGQCYMKEINRAGNKIKCISVNKDYEPFYIERDVDFKVFGRILPRIRL